MANLIDMARYGFRGTDQAFYDYQLKHSIEKFGKDGFYSGSKQKTSITLDPESAKNYAELANEKALARKKELEKSGISSFSPILILIDLQNYKGRIQPGLESSSYEYEINGPISLNDIQILQKDHINNIESYLTEIAPGRYLEQHESETKKDYLKFIKDLLREVLDTRNKK